MHGYLIADYNLNGHGPRGCGESISNASCQAWVQRRKALDIDGVALLSNREVLADQDDREAAQEC